jgi:mono/diheme cytochrome c family protein
VKKILKGLGVLLVVLFVGIAAVVGTCAAKWPPEYPDTPKPDITASDDPTVIERGKYLVNAVAHCAACHSPVEEYTASKPGDVVPPKGGHEWHMGPIGVVRSANITPHERSGIGKQTDAEIARAIRHGVKSDGHAALFMMGVGPMSDEDLTAIISYLRTIDPVDYDVPESDVGLLGKVLMQGPMSFFAAPHEYECPPFVMESDTPSVERGRYLAEGPGFCAGCHSNYEADPDIKFVGQVCSGNDTEPTPDETDTNFALWAPNLTPDPETGHITNWTQDQFMKRFRAGRMYGGSPMPWEAYGNMTDVDLESLWLYLRSLPPTKKHIGETRKPANEKPGD